MNVFNDERDWPPMAQMRQIFTDCSVHQLSVSIGIISVSGQFFMFIFVVSENNIIFALNSVATAVV
mgnify:CR=1 FL=1